MIVERIAEFVAQPARGDFKQLALDAFAFQYERIEAYRALCDRRGTTPSRVTDWRQMPPVPALAFKSLALYAAEPREIFRSSGTTASSRSTHHHPFPDLYRAVIDASFPDGCLAPLRQPPMLSLIPSREQAPDSSLAFMLDHVLRTHGAPDSLVAFGPRGVETRAARSFLAARQRDRRPTLILATTFALVELLDSLERLDIRFRLPVESKLFETGGTKGHTRQVRRDELVERLADRLALPREAIVHEYGMTELTSQCYTASGPGADPQVFLPPPWVRVRILEPESLQEQPPGEPGLIAIFDLANVGSALHLLTEDLGATRGEGFRLLGRAAGAELRGCSLTVEELTG